MSGTGHTYHILAYGDPVSDRSAGVRYAQISALVKENTPASPSTVANEAVATSLAQVLGLPVPVGGIVPADGDGLAWASLHFGPGGQRPPPVIPGALVQDHPRLAAGVIAFDCWILNDDRHAGNLAYARNLVPVAVFDHGARAAGTGHARSVSTRRTA